MFINGLKAKGLFFWKWGGGAGFYQFRFLPKHFLEISLGINKEYNKQACDNKINK